MMFEEFSEKQKSFVKDVKTNNLSRINILQGSVRSRKTYVSLIAWLMLIVKYPRNSNFLMIGKTITSLKRNCLVLLQSLCGSSRFSFSPSRKEAVLLEERYI
ncbi:MAG: hypothetical protein LBF33_02135 [Oscillospiraceae bacterium]|jgi:hypothetical protein|nr:hypothetical protein [Oscillospiraceae bacterium]